MATSITQSGVALPHSTPRGARHLRPRSTSARAAARSRHRSGDRSPRRGAELLDRASLVRRRRGDACPAGDDRPRDHGDGPRLTAELCPPPLFGAGSHQPGRRSSDQPGPRCGPPSAKSRLRSQEGAPSRPSGAGLRRPMVAGLFAHGHRAGCCGLPRRAGTCSLTDGLIRQVRGARPRLAGPATTSTTRWPVSPCSWRSGPPSHFVGQAAVGSCPATDPRRASPELTL